MLSPLNNALIWLLPLAAFTHMLLSINAISSRSLLNLK